MAEQANAVQCDVERERENEGEKSPLFTCECVPCYRDVVQGRCHVFGRGERAKRNRNMRKVFHHTMRCLTLHCSQTDLLFIISSHIAEGVTVWHTVHLNGVVKVDKLEAPSSDDLNK